MTRPHYRKNAARYPEAGCARVFELGYSHPHSQHVYMLESAMPEGRREVDFTLIVPDRLQNGSVGRGASDPSQAGRTESEGVGQSETRSEVTQITISNNLRPSSFAALRAAEGRSVGRSRVGIGPGRKSGSVGRGR